MDYGVTNRLLAKRKGGDAGGSAREILARRRQPDLLHGRAREPVRLQLLDELLEPAAEQLLAGPRWTARASPTERQRDVAAEYDPSNGGLQSISAERAGGGQRLAQRQRRLQPAQAHEHRPAAAHSGDNYVTATTNLRTPSNRVGGIYTFNYDIGRSTLLNSRIVGYYNAQCCGVAVEYQTYNFPQVIRSTGVNKDRRFNFSFTLAGLGTFSNFFGALGGATR